LGFFLQFFLRVVGLGFCWGFCEFWRANVVSLHGECGGSVVETWSVADSKSALKNVTQFWDLFFGVRRFVLPDGPTARGEVTS
jgi:hypothetical protein